MIQVAITYSGHGVLTDMADRIHSAAQMLNQPSDRWQRAPLNQLCRRCECFKINGAGSMSVENQEFGRSGFQKAPHRSIDFFGQQAFADQVIASSWRGINSGSADSCDTFNIGHDHDTHGVFLLGCSMAVIRQ